MDFDNLNPQNLKSQSTEAVEYRGVRPSRQWVSWYDIKPSDGVATALEIWGMWSIHLLPLLPGPLWPGVVAPERVK